MSIYTVTAMTGGHDQTFDSLEAARAYAGELLGENDSLDIHITDETGLRHLTSKQLAFVETATDPMKGVDRTIFQQGDMNRLKRTRRERQDEIVRELTAALNKHDLAGIAFLVPEADGRNRGLMIVNKKRSTVIEFLAQTIGYCQEVLQGLVNGLSRPGTDD